MDFDESQTFAMNRVESLIFLLINNIADQKFSK